MQALRDLRYPDLNIKLYPAALTLEQIRELRLPSSPLKETEARAARWREIHGHDRTQVGVDHAANCDAHPKRPTSRLAES